MRAKEERVCERGREGGGERVREREERKIQELTETGEGGKRDRE